MTPHQARAGTIGEMPAPAAEATPRADRIDLPTPRLEGGKSLLSALWLRHSTREYSDRPLSLALLSELLWVAFGVNRQNGDRTAPYWRHVMVIDVYVAMADGVWLYEPATHAMTRYARDDIRARTGLQDFVGEAPINLIYVAHAERMTDVAAEDRRLYASVDTGFIGQNVYLFCASEGLGTVFRGAVDYPGLAAALRLRDTQFVTFAQTVGYPRT
jgi:nitroreductase